MNAFKEMMSMENIRKKTMRAMKKSGIFLIALLLVPLLLPAGAAANEFEPYRGAGVLNVVVPASLEFTIDPFEIAGKGQIYSKPYRIENNGDTDVLLTLSEMRVFFTGEGEFESLSEPFDANAESTRKAIRLSLDFSRSELPSVVLTDPNHAEDVRILLSAIRPGEEEAAYLSLSLSGSVNHAPAADWRDGDVNISLHYSMEAVLPEEEAIADAQDREQNEDRPDEAMPPRDEEDTNTTPAALDADWPAATPEKDAGTTSKTDESAEGAPPSGAEAEETRATTEEE
jgi:hypothetical protein